jgi:hypothetical protein
MGRWPGELHAAMWLGPPGDGRRRAAATKRPGRCRAAAADPTMGPTVGRDPAREAPRPGWPPLDRALPRSPGSTATR